jgi:hypothetical protein
MDEPIVYLNGAFVPESQAKVRCWTAALMRVTVFMM